jgi:phage terminase large subunit
MPNSIVLGNPNAKQQMFLRSKVRYTAYGGARGGGKSWAVRFKATLLALNYTGITMLVLRRTYPELLHNHILPLQAILRDVARYKETDKTFYFPNGSRIIFGYCDSDRDINRYQGQEYDVIFMDEATHFTEFMFDRLKVCIRGTNGLPKRFYLTCNPGGVGHEWVKRLFVTREYRAGENPDDYTFIKATVYDNVNLLESDPEYVAQLESLPPDLRKAWLEGSWDLFAGQFFPEWNPDIHTIAPMYIESHWRKYIALDYGSDMLACYWVAMDEYGNGYVYRELYEGRDNHMGANNAGHIASSAVERILELTPDDEEIELVLAPPDLWNKQNQTGRSVADIFHEGGLTLTKVSNDRINGWLNMKEWLRVIPDEFGNPTSRLRIFNTCKNLIRCIPALQYDEKKINDAATQPHEVTHAPDAIRYLCVYWTHSAELKRTEKKAKWTSDMWDDYYNADADGKVYLLQKWGNPF